MFNVGDRVVAVKELLFDGFPLGSIGTVIEVTDLGDLRVEWDDKSIKRTGLTGEWFFEKFEVKPGTRIRGVIEGVVQNGYAGDYVRFPADSSDRLVYLKDMTNITILKTLPTKSGSLVSLGSSDYVLTQDNKDDIPGCSWKLVSGFGHRWLTAEELGDDWTLRFDAGA